MQFLSLLAIPLGVSILAFLCNVIYNYFLHPLAHVPGPFAARLSGLPSMLHAVRGDRHLWLWQLHEIYGPKVRISPNAVHFRSTRAQNDIYSMTANVKKSRYYECFRRDHRALATSTLHDKSQWSKQRRLLNAAFSENMVRSAAQFVIKHVDRWHELLSQDMDADWSALQNMTQLCNNLTFDIASDLLHGKSLELKEPGDNPFSILPHSLINIMQFYNSIGRSPFFGLYRWLKPRGLDYVLTQYSPPEIKKMFMLMGKMAADRHELQQVSREKPEAEQRLDMYHFLAEARDPDTRESAYDPVTLRGESSGLMIAGTDTTSATLSAFLFYITRYPHAYKKVTSEIRSTYTFAEDIFHDTKLRSCKYFKACLDETMRLSPAAMGDSPREVLPGGLIVAGQHFPPGTIVSTSKWSTNRDDTVYDNPLTYSPERWFPDESVGRTEDEVKRMRAAFAPFAAGPPSCPGKSLALMELSVTLAKTIHRFDMRKPEGEVGKLGEGRPDMQWGERSPNIMVMKDVFIAKRNGPVVQFRRVRS